MSIISSSIASMGRSIEGAVVKVFVFGVLNGVQFGFLGSGFMIGPNSVAISLHLLDHQGITSVTVDTSGGHQIPADMNAQYYVDLSAWHSAVVANGGELIPEMNTDVAVLKTSQAIGFQTGWFPLYDLHSGPVTVYGYPGLKYTVFTGGVLREITTNLGNYSLIEGGGGGAPGDSGGLVMDAAGNAVGSIVGGSGTWMAAVDFSPTMIANLNGSIAINNAAIAPEIAGRESYYLAHQMSPEWADFNLSALVSQLGGPDTATVSEQIQSTVENAIVAAVQEVGPEVVVSFIAQKFDVSLSPEEHQAVSTVLGGTHQDQINLIGLLENAMLPFMGTIPM